MFSNLYAIHIHSFDPAFFLNPPCSRNQHHALKWTLKVSALVACIITPWYSHDFFMNIFHSPGFRDHHVHVAGRPGGRDWCSGIHRETEDWNHLHCGTLGCGFFLGPLGHWEVVKLMVSCQRLHTWCVEKTPEIRIWKGKSRWPWKSSAFGMFSLEKCPGIEVTKSLI